MRREVRHLLIVALVATSVFFTLLGASSLWDEDEPKNAACAREMLDAGNWIVPQFNYQLRTDKPILLYWLMMTAYSVFGVTEFAARFWSATVAVGTTLLTLGIGRRLYGGDVGLWAGLAMAGCVMFAVGGRAATPDSLLIFCTTAAFYAFVRFGGVETGRLSLGGHLALYAAMGTAVLAKGPVGVVLPSAVIGLYLLLRPRELDATRSIWNRFAPRRVLEVVGSMRPLVLLVVVGVIAVPWYAAVGIQTDGRWLAGFLGTHNVARFTGTMENHSGSVLYYPAAVLIGFFPWSCFLPWGIYRLVRRLRTPDDLATVATSSGRSGRPDLFVACWAGLYLTFFSIAGTKLPSYVLPCYPALAVLVGKLIDEWLAAPVVFPNWAVRTALAAPIVVGLALVIGLSIAAPLVLPGEALLGLVGIPLVVGGAAALWCCVRQQRRPAAIGFAAMSSLFVVGLTAIGAARVSTHATSPAVVKAARAVTTTAPMTLDTPANAPVSLIAYRHYEPTLVYYARSEVPTVATQAELRRELDRRPGAVIVTRDEFLEELRSAVGGGASTPLRLRRFLRRDGEIVLLVPATAAEVAAGTVESRR